MLLIITIVSLYFSSICGENSVGVVRHFYQNVPLKDRLLTRQSQAEFGIQTGANVYEAICWYEYLKKYKPNTRSLNFNQCHGQASFQRHVVHEHRADERFFGQFLLKFAMDKLPPEYMECAHYLLEDRHSRPMKLYSNVLNGDQGKVEYPYQGFSHCLLSVLHDKYKDDQALIDIGEKLAHPTNWAQTMLNRENEFRALHKVPALTPSDELNKRAQLWAEKNARDCSMYHIYSSHLDYYLNGSRMGENLFSGDNIKSPKEDMALFAINNWYEEINFYPWPEYTGFGSDPFLAFSHFSQMIWKDTKFSGYGFAVNSSASCGRYFIVSRYFPPGNFWERFAENLLPREN